MAGQPPHSLPSGTTAFVASVAAPSLTSAMLDQLQRRFEHVHVVRTSAECAGVRIAYAKPENSASTASWPCWRPPRRSARCWWSAWAPR
jgi:hypothetical protein